MDQILKEYSTIDKNYIDALIEKYKIERLEVKLDFKKYKFKFEDLYLKYILAKNTEYYENISELDAERQQYGSAINDTNTKIKLNDTAQIELEGLAAKIITDRKQKNNYTEKKNAYNEVLKKFTPEISDKLLKTTTSYNELLSLMHNKELESIKILNIKYILSRFIDSKANILDDKLKVLNKRQQTYKNSHWGNTSPEFNKSITKLTKLITERQQKYETDINQASINIEQLKEEISAKNQKFNKNRADAFLSLEYKVPPELPIPVIFDNKYLKYKQKYLKLKESLN